MCLNLQKVYFSFWQHHTLLQKPKAVCGSASLSLWISMSFWGKFQLFNIFRFDFDDKASSGLKHFPSAGFNEIYIWIQECWCCLNGNNANASQNITSRIYTIHKIDNSFMTYQLYFILLGPAAHGGIDYCANIYLNSNFKESPRHF